MNKTLVSIITPSYSSKMFITQTIQSVLNQTYGNFELIIIDDASPDNSNFIIENFIKIDKRIKLIKINKNIGAAAARNKGIASAKGDYLAFLDSDDLWHREKLEKQIRYMEKNNYSFTYTKLKHINEKSETLSKKIYTPTKVSYNDLLISNHLGCLTVIYSVKDLGKIFMPLIKKRQDYALWLKILKKVDFAYCLEEELAYYRVTKNSISNVNKFELIKYHYLLFNKFEKLSLFKSVYYTTLNIITKFIYR